VWAKIRKGRHVQERKGGMSVVGRFLRCETMSRYLCLRLPRHGQAWTTRRDKAVLFYTTVHTSVKTAVW
jgi:hypothetical protein